MANSIKKINTSIHLKSWYKRAKDIINIGKNIKDCVINAALIDKHNRINPYNKNNLIIGSDEEFLNLFLTKQHIKNIMHAFSILPLENIRFSLSSTTFYIILLTHKCDIYIEIEREYMKEDKIEAIFNNHLVNIIYKRYNFNIHDEKQYGITYKNDSEILKDFDYLPIIKKILKEVYYPKYTEYTAEQYDMSRVNIF
jgi:hypothetical protein